MLRAIYGFYRDIPIRRKLQAAILLSASLPMVLIAAFSLIFYLDYSRRAMENSLDEKLKIGELILSAGISELTRQGDILAGDNGVRISLGLDLREQLRQILEGFLESSIADGVAILDGTGNAIASYSRVGEGEWRLPTSGVIEAFVRRSGTNDRGTAAMAIGSAFVALAPIIESGDSTGSYVLVALGFDAARLKGQEILERMREKTGASFAILREGSVVGYAAGPNGPARDEALSLTEEKKKTGTPWRVSASELNEIEPGATGRLYAIMSESQLRAGRNLTFAIAFCALLLGIAISYALGNAMAAAISRPIAAVAEGSRDMARGNFDISITPAGRDEIGMLTEDFTLMASKIRALVTDLNREIEDRRIAERTAERLASDLERRVDERTKELSDANRALSDSIDQLTKTQRDLIESEKLAVMGRIAAGILHEINTPLGAIASSARTIATLIYGRIGEAAGALRGMGDEAAGVLRVILRESAADFDREHSLEPDKERKTRRKISATLLDAGLAEAEETAQLLSELGIRHISPKLLSILRGPDREKFLSALEIFLGSARAAEVAGESVTRASQVMGALRSYTGITATTEGTEVLLPGGIHDVLESLRTRIPANVRVLIECEGEVSVLARKDSFERVMDNLLLNAFHAVRSGGTVRIGVKPENARVRLEIEDNGPGIPSESQKRIFEPFFTTKINGEGVGLGLSIARRLALDDGGDITFRSRPGCTVFTAVWQESASSRRSTP